MVCRCERQARKRARIVSTEWRTRTGEKRCGCARCKCYTPFGRRHRARPYTCERARFILRSRTRLLSNVAPRSTFHGINTIAILYRIYIEYRVRARERRDARIEGGARTRAFFICVTMDIFTHHLIPRLEETSSHDLIWCAPGRKT